MTPIFCLLHTCQPHMPSFLTIALQSTAREKNDCMGCNYIPKNVAHQANTGTKFSVIKKTSDSNKKGNMEFAVFSFDSLYKPQMSI